MRLRYLVCFLLFCAGTCGAQSSYQGLTPGASTRADAEKSFGLPVRTEGGVSEYHPPADSGVTSIVVQYKTDSTIVERIEVYFPSAVDRSALIRTLGLPEEPAATRTAEGKLVEYFGSPQWLVLTYAAAKQTDGVSNLGYYSPELFALAVGKDDAKSSGPSAPPSAVKAVFLRSPLAVTHTPVQLGWLAPDPKYKTARGATKLHLGVDFEARYGEPVFAIADGEVVGRRTDVTNFGGDAMPGGAIVIRHRLPKGKTIYALYGHLEQPTRADAVTAGQVIGRVGHFYHVSGGELVDRPCLHLGIFVGAAPPLDPYLTFIDPALHHSQWVNPLTLLSETKH